MRTTYPGVFPTCGCHYTTADDGIHFCRLHHEAQAMLDALIHLVMAVRGRVPKAGADLDEECKAASSVLHQIGSDDK